MTRAWMAGLLMLAALASDGKAQQVGPAAFPPGELGSGISQARPIEVSGVVLANQAYRKTQSARSVEDYAEIIDLCQQALATQLEASVKTYAEKLLAWAANRRGELLSQQAARFSAAGQLEEAAQADEQALADFTLAVESDASKWKPLHNRGVSLALAGRYEEALTDLTQALELNNNYVNTWFNRAEVRYELGQYEDAAADYGEVIQRQPDDFGAFTGRGHAWLRMGELAKALADYHRAVTLDSKSAGAFINRGDVYRHLGQWEQAAADYRQAVKLDESYGRAYRAAAWLMATCPNDRLRNTDLALRAAEKAIELDGAEDYTYLDVLAAAYANAGQYSEAVETIRQAIQAAPEEVRLPLEERLNLYQAGKPYRLSHQTAVRPTPARR